jgi:hypothetical protein
VVVAKHRALKAPAIEGSQQGQILKKSIRLDFYLRESNGVPTKLWGFPPPLSVGSPLQSQPNEIVVPHGKEPELA